ncbi:hypothetical protein [Aquimarina sp. MMG016]|uniref:hypothetical protein n=1 Tax=Aquimarina sp. MMG016 TaxID=2822690 RepID=UPI001B39DCC6|nr:hypothetical protein [Aquimarina sp. MMG016]MBQ4822710.1 hypothetical protein [Aquimarina sp. MMG016]
MIKNLENFGKSLTKEQQKEINGGNIGGRRCNTNRDCWDSSPFLGPGDVSCRYSPFSSFKVCVFN